MAETYTDPLDIAEDKEQKDPEEDCDHSSADENHDFNICAVVWS